MAERLRLYVVTDERPDGDSLLAAVQAAIAGGATAVQLRRKRDLGRRFVELGRAVRTLTREAGVLFVVNDRVDVAVLVDADGVHVGQDDIPCADARRLMGDRIVGVSAETVEEALQAERDGADYLGVGSVYPTQSKPDAGFAGLDGLREIVRRLHIPVVGIGGINLANAADVMRCGACGIAVVSAVMSAPDPGEAARRLRQLIG
ncbi:MAG: thiamine phosphate synthase [Alicyclobacillaceae bacterium]|nr:thiamine phosphate synthase [Alicyclobacillaceae bacterium]